MADSLTRFLGLLDRLQLLTSQQFESLQSTIQQQSPDLKSVVSSLLKKGWLTRFQLDAIQKDQGKSLVLGQYRLIDSLGAGGMGQVYRARHVPMQRIVALKVIRQERLDNPGMLSRFQGEIKALASLKPHPNVVVAHDAGVENSLRFLAMEYIEGIDLSRLIQQRGPLPVGEACEYTRQAALGLQHAHAHGLVHRDIKPANLMLASASDEQPTVNQSSGRIAGMTVKLLDLGLARLKKGSEFGGLTAEGVLLGTPDYIAPEQIEAAREVDIRADIYSLGCTLYHLLTGRPPFPDGSIPAKIHAHKTLTPTPVEEIRKDLPEGLGTVLRTMMARSPADRYRTPAEVASALAPYCPNSVPVAQVAPVPATSPVLPPSQGAGTSSVVVKLLRSMNQTSGRLWFVLGVMVCLLALIVFLLLRPGAGSVPSPLLTVRIEGVAQVHDPNMMFELDGKRLTGKQLQEPIELAAGPHELVILRRDAVVEKRKFQVGPEDKDGRIVVLAEPEDDVRPGLITTFQGHKGEVYALAFIDDGRRFVSCGEDGKVLLWDVRQDLPVSSFQAEFLVARAGISPDGFLVVLGGHERRRNGERGALRLSVHETVGGREVCRFQGVSKLSTLPQALAFSPDGTRVYSGYAFYTRSKQQYRTESWVWDARTGEELRRIEGGEGCFTADGRHLFVNQQQGVALWEIDRRVVPSTIEVPEMEAGAARSLACSPRNHLLAFSVYRDNQHCIRVVNRRGGEGVRTLEVAPDRSSSSMLLAFSPDERRILATYRFGLRLVDVETGNLLWSHGEAGKLWGYPLALAYSPSGRRALTSTHTRELGIQLWSLPK